MLSWIPVLVISCHGDVLDGDNIFGIRNIFSKENIKYKYKLGKNYFEIWMSVIVKFRNIHV